MLWFQVVEGVIKSLVESLLPQTAPKTKGKDFPHGIIHPVKMHVKGQPTVTNSVQNPGAPSSAQVNLEEEMIRNLQ